MSTRYVGGMRNSISEIVFQGQSNRNENILLPENIWKLQVSACSQQIAMTIENTYLLKYQPISITREVDRHFK